MPREVFAEEIERFLGTVEGVGAARVLTTPAGEITQIHVTAGGAVDSATVRRAVVSALATAYGLPIEPWRIQVAQFRSGPRPAEIPQFRLVHVEESVSATETVAAVRITWVEGGEKRTAVGKARGPTPHRTRTLATATIEAARTALESPHRQVTLQQVSLTTFMDQPAALVGISVSTPRGPEIHIGAALRNEVQDAVILAALDAVTKWLLKTALASAEAHRAGDRRAQLDAMRHFVRTAERPEARAVGENPPFGTVTRGDVRARGQETSVGESAGPPDIAALQEAEPDVPATGPPEEMAGLGIVAPRVRLLTTEIAAERPGGEISKDPDVLEDLSQIRPEDKGGADMAVHQDPSRASVVPPRAGRTSMEDTFYQGLIGEQTPVHLRCRDGYEIPHAVVKDVGTYTLLVETGGGTELVYKHAIISIRLLTAPTPEA